MYEYVPAIRHSYWIHTEFNFTSDIQDFKSRLSDTEKNAIKNTMLAISQIEVAVKSFGDLYHRMPKPEIGSVGATFAESEVRHADAYSHLLEILGLNKEFKEQKKKPVIMKRVQYLEVALKNSKSEENKEYAESVLLLFPSLLNMFSLFSQFLIIMAFNKHKNMLKGISNVVEATSKEEQIHGDFGIDLIKILQKEQSHWFTPEYKENIQKICQKAYKARGGFGGLDF